MREFTIDDDQLRELFAGVLPHLDERQKRIVTGNVAMSLGRGGITAVAEAAEMSRSTVQTAVREIDEGVEVSDRVRSAGAGRKPIEEEQPGIAEAIEAFVRDDTRGDPMSPLLWTSKSTTHISQALTKKGYRASHSVVGKLLHKLGYSLQSLFKTKEGMSHPDRDAQFNYLNGLIKEYLNANDPVISVDGKKKEAVGEFSNGGVEYQPKGQPQKVNGHDFATDKAAPYGVYDIANNEGFVNVGDNADTAQFAMATIEHWWTSIGCERFPNAKRLLITADAGGSNGCRLRLWKRGLAEFSEKYGIEVTVCHFPPGTSKWNKIEHRLFSQITKNWRGRPLESHEAVVSLIANTTTKTGLKVRARRDTTTYERGIKISKKEIDGLKESGVLTLHDFHGDWNYTTRPSSMVNCASN
jgi:transposase